MARKHRRSFQANAEAEGDKAIRRGDRGGEEKVRRAGRDTA